MTTVADRGAPPAISQRRRTIRHSNSSSRGDSTGHVFLRMLAYHVEWHMRRALAPILFDDDDPGAAETLHASPAPLRSRPKPSGSSASNREPYPVAYTPETESCHHTATTCRVPGCGSSL